MIALQLGPLGATGGGAEASPLFGQVPLILRRRLSWFYLNWNYQHLNGSSTSKD